MSSVLTSNVHSMRVVALTFDPAQLSTGPSVGEQDFTVPGVKVGDLVFVNKPSLTAAATIGNARVKSADTISVQFVASAGTPNPASETYLLLVVRPQVAGTDAFM